MDKNSKYLGATFRHTGVPYLSFTLGESINTEGGVPMCWEDGVKGTWEYSVLHQLADSPDYIVTLSKKQLLKSYFNGQE